MPAPIVHEGLAVLRVSEPAVLDEVAAAIEAQLADEGGSGEALRLD